MSPLPSALVRSRRTIAVVAVIAALGIGAFIAMATARPAPVTGVATPTASPSPSPTPRATPSRTPSPTASPTPVAAAACPLDGMPIAAGL
ncbi:MAG: hypothetical protein ABI622_11300, partial [Chloroflexota bacterium]